MQSTTHAVPVGKTSLWTGRILSALPVLMLAFSAIMKLLKPAPVVQGFAQYGYPEYLLVPLGIVEMLCAVVYVIPRTAVLGAILMTGYLGGATATNVRVGDPSFLIPVLLGVLAWAGLFLRDDRLRALLPMTRP
jgi:DoxX-like protein